MSQTDYEKSCGICGMIPHHSKCRVRELETKLAEAQAALLHIEADRDGCLKIMFSSEHGKEIRELQVEVIRLRAQLAESNAALADSRRLHAEASKNGQDLYTLAASLRAKLERSPCGHLVEALKNLLEACYQADAFEVLPAQITGELMDAARKALMTAPASQPTTEHVKEGEK